MDIFKSTLSAAVLLASLSATSVFAADAKPIAMLKDIPFAEGLDVAQAIKDECQLGEKVVSFIVAYGKKDVAVTDTVGTGKYLDMQITQVFAPGGGAWSGPKWLEVSGTLKDGNKDVARFRAKRFSGGGAFGGFKGTCAILGRTTKALGKDIATWLKNPTDGAALGDAKKDK